MEGRSCGMIDGLIAVSVIIMDVNKSSMKFNLCCKMIVKRCVN